MKKFLIFLMILFCVMPLMGCSKDDTSSQVIRIHIRANSNSNVDQDIKLVVRDEILKYAKTQAMSKMCLQTTLWK